MSLRDRYDTIGSRSGWFTIAQERFWFVRWDLTETMIHDAALLAGIDDMYPNDTNAREYTIHESRYSIFGRRLWVSAVVQVRPRAFPLSLFATNQQQKDQS